MPNTNIDPPSGTDIYDALMGDIEMDLVSVNLPLLEEKYKDETTEQKAARYKRYEAAYAAYDKAFAEWEKNLKADVAKYRREALASAEIKSKEEEKTILTDIETKFSTAS